MNSPHHGGRLPPDLSLYLVTDTRLCGDHGVVRTVTEAVDAGVSLVQLRDPDCSDTDLVTLGTALIDVLAGTGVPLIVDDRVHLVHSIGAAGAHVGQSDMDPVEARRRLGPDRWLGLSTQTIAHVEAARRLPTHTIDYLGVGSVWPQNTKSDATPIGGPSGLTKIVRESPWPCVAIGGINTASRVAEARQAGVNGVAVVSAICGQPDVGAAAQQLRQAWDNVI